MTGKMYGSWKVIKYLGKDKHSHHILLCECQCDKKTMSKINKNDLLKNKSKSCGKCNTIEIKKGNVFHNWIVIKNLDGKKALCQCNCIYKTIREVSINSLRQGTSKSCGCVTKFHEGQIVENWKILKFLGTNKDNQFEWLCECVCESKTLKKLTTSKLSQGCPSSCGCLNPHNTYELLNDYGIGYTIKGEKFYFDLEDYDKIKNMYWCVVRPDKNNEGYVFATKNKKRIFMHRFVLDKIPNGKIVDHINRHPNDNRKSNLRICDYSVNNRNRRKTEINTSGYVGVSWDKSRDKWIAFLKINNKFINLGRFNNIEDAYSARKNGELKYFDELINHNEIPL